MEVVKSSRHQKILGDFGEALVCNWLSRSGFEVSVVDHTGIDIVAFDPNTSDRLGISVKSRTRGVGRESSSVNIISYQKSKSDRQKISDACTAFACEPWIAIYVETTKSADLFMLSLDHYDRKYRGNPDRAIDTWKMGEKYRKSYEIDVDVKHIHMNFLESAWWE
jgi:hypothetical protein